MERTPLQFAMAAAGLVTALSAAINNYFVVSDFVFSHFALVFTAAAALGIYGIWPPPDRRPVGYNPSFVERGLLLRFRFVILTALAYSLGIAFFIWETEVREVDGPPPVLNPNVPLNSNQQEPSSLSFISPAQATGSAKALSLVRFSLDSTRTTFVERGEMDFSGSAPPGNPCCIKTFGLDPRWNTVRKPGTCMLQVSSMFDDLVDAQQKTRQAFLTYFRVAGKENLASYIKPTEVINDLISKRPDIAQQMIPTEAEWKSLNALGPDGQESASVVLNWIRYCVPIPFPTFEFIVQNQLPDGPDVVITDLAYDVEAIGGYGGLESGVLTPLHTYSFDLPYSAGKVTQKLEPAFVIPKGQARSFRLTLYTSTQQIGGLSWRMRIGLVSNFGTVTTEQFQLLMTSRPEWALGHLK